MRKIALLEDYSRQNTTMNEMNTSKIQSELYSKENVRFYTVLLFKFSMCTSWKKRLECLLRSLRTRR